MDEGHSHAVVDIDYEKGEDHVSTYTTTYDTQTSNKDYCGTIVEVETRKVKKRSERRAHITAYEVLERYDPFAVKVAVMADTQKRVHVNAHTGDDDGIMDSDPIEVGRDLKKRRVRRAPRKMNSANEKRGLRRRLGERELFKEVLTGYLQNIGHVSIPLEGRLVAGTICGVRAKRDGRQAAFFSGVAEREHDGCRTGHASIYWQTMVRPKRAVILTVSDEEGKEGFKVTCTCDILLECFSHNDPGCLHTELLFQNMDVLQSMIHTARGRVLREPREIPGSDYQTRQRNIERKGVGTFEVGNLIEARTEGRRKRIVVRRPTAWQLWVTLESDEGPFVPVIKQKGRPFRCLVCRGLSSRRGLCYHERDCKEQERRRGKALRGAEKDRGDINEEDEDLSEISSSSSEDDLPVDVRDASRAVRSNTGEPVIGALNHEELARRVAGEESESVAEIIRKSKMKYYMNKKKHGILMCSSEVTQTRVLSQRLESTKVGSYIFLRDRGDVRCQKGHKRRADDPRMWRVVRLCTLSHGAPFVLLQDWICPKCLEVVFYKGEMDGVFPAQRFLAFTTEIMYHFMRATCLEGVPMRKAFSITCDLTCSQSMLHSLRMRNLQVGSWKANWKGRRIANEALREFIRLTDFSSPKIPQLLFTCSECEVPLTREDMEELQLSDIPPDGRRFKAVVVDGTAQGILGTLPKYNNKKEELFVSSALKKKQKLLTRKGSLSLVKKLLVATYAFMRDASKMKRRGNTASTVSFLVSRPAPPGISCDMPLSKEEIFHLRLYLQDKPCFCNRKEGEEHQSHTQNCRDRNGAFKEQVGILNVLRGCFKMEEVQGTDTNDVERTEGSVEAEAADQDTSHSSSDESEQDQQGDEEHGEEGAPEEQGEGNVQMRNCRMMRRKEWKVYFTIPVKGRTSQLSESVLDTVDLILFENSAMAFAKPVRDAANLKAKVHGNTREAGNQRDDTKITALSLHRDYVCSLRNWGHCDHEGRSSVTLSCRMCDMYLKETALLIREVNPIFSRLAREIMNVSRREALVAHAVAQILGAAMDLHFNNASKYMDKFEMKATDECKAYQEKYCRYDLSPIGGGTELEDATGLVFPGRDMYRPCMSFTNAEFVDCTKKYPVSKLHSPGLFTVQCVCGHPKVIGVMVMTHAESISMAISSIITHFLYPPRVVFYDNACHFGRSLLVRVIMFLTVMLLLVDRFHFNGHKCNSLHDADRYQSQDYSRSSAAESFNARFKQGLGQARYLSGSNFLPFLRVRCALLNLSALFKQKFSRTEVDEEDLSGFLRSIYTCQCSTCISTGHDGNEGDEAREERAERGEVSGDVTEQDNQQVQAEANRIPDEGDAAEGDEVESQGRDSSGAQREAPHDGTDKNPRAAGNAGVQDLQGRTGYNRGTRSFLRRGRRLPSTTELIHSGRRSASQNAGIGVALSSSGTCAGTAEQQEGIIISSMLGAHDAGEEKIARGGLGNGATGSESDKDRPGGQEEVARTESAEELCDEDRGFTLIVSLFHSETIKSVRISRLKGMFKDAGLSLDLLEDLIQRFIKLSFWYVNGDELGIPEDSVATIEQYMGDE